MNQAAIGSVALAVSVLAYWTVVPARRRNLFLLALSVCGAAALSIPYTVYFICSILIVHTAARLMRGASARRKPVLAVTVGWLVANLCFFKYVHAALAVLGAAVPGLAPVHLPGIVFPLGLSYITFRQIHYIVEVYRAALPAHSLADYALYVLFFPTFLAGPVERFPAFAAQAQRTANGDLGEINAGLRRILTGAVKKFIVADLLAVWLEPVLQSPQNYPRGLVILCVYGHAVRIYMDFSGYTDMAIGTGNLFGFRIMENFNYPLFRRNIALFWRNWHISVYTWIRDYFFLPVFGHHPSGVKTCLGIFLSFLLFSAWHGLSAGFVILGTVHGAAMVAWYAFNEVKARSTVLRRILERPYVYPVSVFCTFSFVSFSFIFFNGSMDRSLHIVRRILGIL